MAAAIAVVTWLSSAMMLPIPSISRPGAQSILDVMDRAAKFALQTAVLIQADLSGGLDHDVELALVALDVVSELVELRIEPSARRGPQFGPISPELRHVLPVRGDRRFGVAKEKVFFGSTGLEEIRFKFTELDQARVRAVDQPAGVVRPVVSDIDQHADRQEPDDPTNYLQLPTTLHVDAQTAGERLSFYWGGAMIGRFIGSWLLNRIAPGKLLTGFAIAAAALVLISLSTTGGIAGWSLIAVGLFNSIMFPTVFSLASEGQGARTPQVSGLLCMAIVGGAIVPLATGALADATSIGTALFIPVVCYAVIAAFGLAAMKPLPASHRTTVAASVGD
jgi:hypothetical protein